MSAPPEVEISDLTSIIDDTVVLHQLDLFVPPGRVTVLMGPSGAGKTTLLRHVVGLREPDAGTVRIGGRDVWTLDERQWRRLRQGMGVMLGGSTLFSTSVFSSMTVLDNLTYSLAALGVPENQRRERARERLRELDLDWLADQLPENLSGHATKRLALARALVADAPLTVLDEIDVGLDREHTAAMRDAVGRLHERTGCTLLLTTHNLALARAIADHLAILVHGRIVAAGPPEEVLSGVTSTEDFDRRFEFSDFAGPPRLDDALAVVARPEGSAGPEPENRRSFLASGIGSGPLWLILIAGLLVLLLLLAI